MARYGCLALAVIVAMALLIFIVFLWSGWLNRPVGHAPVGNAPMGNAPAAYGVAYSYPFVNRQNQDFQDLGIIRIGTIP